VSTVATLDEQDTIGRHAISFEQKLDRLAEVAVRVGLGLAPGQELVMTSPIEAIPLARLITEHAYKAGAKLVTLLYSDDEATLARYRFAPDESFDVAATWLLDGVAAAYRSGAARLAITGANPALLSNQDPERVGRANKALSKAMRPALDIITRHEINWTIVAAATPAWAKLVFPADDESVAMAKLWDAIFQSTRINVPDPIANWKQHAADLQKRVKYLNDKRYHAIHFRGPGTDLHVGLADDHLWSGGGGTAGNGIFGMANMPTEEVFTTPHCDRVRGQVRSTKPLSHQGTLIENIDVRFENGNVVEAHASEGEAVLQRMIETDEGARKLGEVALVPHSSPIAQSGILFWNTLFDENAASHIALGQAYSTCLFGGEKMSSEELRARGANESLIHVDWMIGSGEMDVDGIRTDGGSEPLMRKGEWAN
jgi:aminopeptidase